MAKKRIPKEIAFAEERLQITSEVLAVAEGEVARRAGDLSPEEVDEAVIVLGELRYDYRVAERNLIRLRREHGAVR